MFITYLGECRAKGTATLEKHECRDRFERAGPEANFPWCRDCRMTVYKLDSKHATHRLHNGAHIDYDSHEYTGAGD